AALAAAGISGDTQNPPGGRIGRDMNRLPNGLLLESAMRMVADVQPPPSLKRRIEGIVSAQELLVSRGITSVGAAVNRGFADDLRAYERLACDGGLRVRVNEFLSWELLEAASDLGIRTGLGGPMVRAGLGVVAVMQPIAARFGRVASSIFFPVRDRKDLAAHRGLMRAGVRVAFSSDLPVIPDPNPWPGIRVAVEDQVNGVSLLASLRAYTAGGAYASFEE